jgi:hypothetical protein
MSVLKKYVIVLLLSFLFSPLFSGEGKTPLRKMKYTSRIPDKAKEWQNVLRKELFQILKLDDLLLIKDTIQFNPKIKSSRENEKYMIQEIKINSTPGRRISVIVTVPKNFKGTRPAVICVHGHGGSRYTVYNPVSIYMGFASKLAEIGYVTIAVDVGQHEVYEKERILMGERLWDLIRCLDYLESRQEVDPSRIGCAGLSLGGEMTMWLGAMDERISGTVSSGFLTVMDQMEQNHCMCWKFDGLRELVDYADIYSLHAPRPLMCQNGEKEGPNDFYVPIARNAMEEINIIYNDFGKADLVKLQVHKGGHVIDLPSLMDFFKKHL